MYFQSKQFHWRHSNLSKCVQMRLKEYLTPKDKTSEFEIWRILNQDEDIQFDLMYHILWKHA